MTWFPEPDIYLVGTTVGGLPTCTFSPRPYPRRVTNIVVNNTVNSGVKCYRGTLGSTPVAQNSLGNNNTLRGAILIPAGQLFFVQWDAVGSTFARVSWERSDNPLEAVDVSSGSEWDTNAITSFSVPTVGDPSVRFGTNIPAEIFTFYAPDLPIAMIQWRQSAGDYIAFVLVDPVAGRSFVDVIGRESVGAALSVANRWRMGTLGIDTSLTVLSSEFTALNGAHFAVGTFEYLAGTILDMRGFMDINPTSALITPGGDNDVMMDGISVGRGFRKSNSATTNIGGIGAEATTVQLGNFTFKDGRAYRVRFGTSITTSLATNTGQWRIRDGAPPGGTLLWTGGAFGPSGTAQPINAQGEAYFRRAVGVGDVVRDLNLTFQPSSGTLTHNGSASSPRYMVLEDCGSYNDWTFAVAI